MNGKRKSMLSLKLYEDIQNYVDEHYLAAKLQGDLEEFLIRDQAPLEKATELKGDVSLEDALGQIDESFSEMLLRKIDDQGISGYPSRVFC